MKQLLQNMRDGKAEVTEVPVPTVKPGYVLVKNRASVVSAGTERMVVEFAEKSLVGKAQSRPDLVRQVLDKAKREGVVSTIQAAFNKLDKPMALGYSSAGIVAAVGEGVTGFQPGMHVACAGGGFAAHAEYGLIPKNLIVPVPNEVPFEEAAFATLGAISLQGFRLATPQVGEKIVIIGLGLLGLLMVGIAKAAGCEVFGVDLDESRIRLADEMGAKAVIRKQAVESGLIFTQGRGFDSVFICADTKSNDPIELAGELVRDKGVVVAVGAVGMNVPRNIYYHKEAAFLISRSYGPGRYDNQYEEQGVDYPYGYVRWTEGRNLEAIVKLIADGKMQINKLISHRYEIKDGVKAYETITGKTEEPFLGVVIHYPKTENELDVSSKTFVPVFKGANPVAKEVNIGVLGAGNYATATFLPIIQKPDGVNNIAISSARGLNARHAAAKFKFAFAGTSEDEIFENEEINTVVLLTRHADHKRQVIKGLQHNKHVYCEKPLALNQNDLDEIRDTVVNSEYQLMVGFNRRFAPLSIALKAFLESSEEPKQIHYRVNAGFLPADHWLHDETEGGGRIIGEGCHFIDYLCFLTEKKPISVSSFGLPDMGKYKEDNVTMVFTFEDGSIGTVAYLANGDKSVPKETVEVFCGGKVAFLNDFRSLSLVSNGTKNLIQNRGGQDKGHKGSWTAFVEALRSGKRVPISFDETYAVTYASFKAVQSLRENKPCEL
jgi:predicted dehydrogenase/threonine dehydrogenase-like Zn-dependent dehydrogenase